MSALNIIKTMLTELPLRSDTWRLLPDSGFCCWRLRYWNTLMKHTYRIRQEPEAQVLTR